MSDKVVAQVFRGFPGSGAALTVMLALAHYAEDTGAGWAYRDDIAAAARVSARTLAGTLAQLRRAGWIRTQARGRAAPPFALNIKRLGGEYAGMGAGGGMPFRPPPDRVIAPRPISTQPCGRYPHWVMADTLPPGVKIRVRRRSPVEAPELTSAPVS